MTVASAALQPSIELLLEAGVEERGIRDAIKRQVSSSVTATPTFAHPLLATAAYETLLPGERRDVHRRLAEVSSGPIERAHHVARAATGPERGEAAETLEVAARVTSELGDHAGAALFLLRAAELSPWPSRERQGRAAPARRRSSRSPATSRRRPSWRATFTTSRPPARPRALARRTLVSAAIGATMSLRRRVELSLALEDAGADDVAAATVHLQLADMTMTIWRVDESRATSRRRSRSESARERRTSSPPRSPRRGSWTACAGWASPRPQFAPTSAGTAPSPHRTPTRRASRSRASACTPGEFAEAARLLQDEIAGGDERGVEVAELVARNHLAEVQTRAGDWAAALVNARLSEEHGRQAANAQAGAATLFPLAYVQALLGDHDAARAVGLDGLARTQAMDDVWYETGHRGVLGLVAFTEDDVDGAIAMLEPAWAAMQRVGIGNPSIFPVPHVLGEAYAAAGRLDDAAAVAAALRGMPAAEHPWCRAMAGRCEALVASARGDHVAARVALDDALAAHAELPEPFERARTLHVQGRVERRARNWAKARAALTEALTEFDALGAARWAEKAGADLARLPGRRPAAAGELTETERRVAALVAEGLSNKEVASRLFVSVRAVEANLSRVYAKLGIRSRTELARTFDAG